jgi:hypothetical protein
MSSNLLEVISSLVVLRRMYVNVAAAYWASLIMLKASTHLILASVSSSEFHGLANL